MSTARLEIVVNSSGVQSADKDLKQLTATAKETERQHRHMADVFAEIAAADEKVIKNAVNASKQAASEKVAAIKKVDDEDDRAAKRAADRAAKENERWNDLKQKALARDEARAASAERAAKRIADAGGLDGVLPKRPSLGRIEGAISGITEALPGAALLAGGAAGVAAAATAKLFDTFKEGAHAVVEAMVELDKLKGRLTGVTGSTEEAQQAFEALEGMTIGKMPFQVKEVADAFIQLRNVGLNPTQESLEAYGNIAAQTGSGIEEFAATVQSTTMGYYRGLRAYGIAAKDEGESVAFTFQGVKTEVQKDAQSIQDYFTQLGNDKFAGGMSRQMTTMAGSLTGLKQSWHAFVESAATAELEKTLAGAVNSLSAMVNSATNLSKGIDWAGFSSSLKGAFSPVFLAADTFKEINSSSAKAYQQAAAAAEDAARAAVGKKKLHQDPLALGSTELDEKQAEVDSAVLERIHKAARDKRRAEFDEHEQNVRDIKAHSAVASKVQIDLLAEEDARYSRALAKKTKEKKSDVGNYDDITYSAKRDENAALRKEDDDYATAQLASQEKSLASTKAFLAKAVDADKQSYEIRKADLAKYLGSDSSELMAENEDRWAKHLADVAAKESKAQLEKQHRLDRIGEKPQSQMQMIATKIAGDYFQLSDALSDDLSGKNGPDKKLRAEETYKAKSVALEKERIREIREANQELIQQSVNNGEALFGNLATAAKNAGGEQSEAYKVMFAAQKAFAIASATVSMGVGIGKAMELGWPAGIPAGIAAAAEGAKVLAIVSSANYSGAHDAGGSIPSGSYGDVAERRPELVMLGSRAQVRGPATVIGGQATAALLGGGQAPQNIRVVNLLSTSAADAHVAGFLGSTQGERVLTNYMQRNGSLIRQLSR